MSSCNLLLIKVSVVGHHKKLEANAMQMSNNPLVNDKYSPLTAKTLSD